MLVLLGLFAWLPGTTATTYYVAGSGDDDNTGLSEGRAFRTIQKAADLVEPGDIVLVMNGTYTNASPSDSVVEITRSGKPGAWITFKAYSGHHPLISFNGWQAIHGTGSYIEIEGFTIVGNSAHLTYDYAYKQRNEADPSCNGDGISIESNRKTNQPFAHHYRIANNSVSYCPGGGINTLGCDYVTIRGNHVFNNSWYSRYAGSGISIYQSRAFDHLTGYHMIVEGNFVYNNYGLIPWQVTQQLSDGNGIIVDDSKNTQNKSPFGPYHERTLVANNVSVHNGGSGIHAFTSEHVDIVNNTTWHNSQKLAYGEIYAEFSNDVNIVNNVCVADNGKPVNSNDKNTNVRYDYNLYSGGLPVAVEGGHTLHRDPLFSAPAADPTGGGFILRSDSPAVGTGTTALALGSDILGAVRPSAGGGIDRGAYQSTARP